MNVTPTDLGFDDAKAEAFAARLADTFSNAAATMMISLGHRAGLFDLLRRSPETRSDALAAQGGFAERYVREWLAVMVTARIVDYAPETGRYRLPAEHAAFLTRAASPDNMAVTSQFFGVLASVEDAMLERLRDGQGLHYHHYDRFHEVMAEDSDQTVVAALVEHILPIAPGLTTQLEAGIDVIDVGCGGGRAMLRLARTFPNSRFTGVDLCAEAFAGAQATAAREGLKNLSFRAADLSATTSLGAFDLVTAFDAVHDQPDPLGLLRTVHRSLKGDGLLLMQDIGGSQALENNIDNPFAPLLYAISLMHCTPVSIGQGGPGLGTMWGVETAEAYLAEAGFGSVETHRLPHDPINAWFVARP